MKTTMDLAVINLFILKGLLVTEIHTKMMSLWKHSAPSFPTIFRWILEFQRSRTSVEDESRSGRS